MTCDQPDHDTVGDGHGETDESSDSSHGDGTCPTFFETFPGPVARYTVEDGTALIRGVNPAFESVFDIAAEDAAGDPLSDHVPADMVDRDPGTNSGGPGVTWDDPGDCVDGDRDTMASGDDVVTYLRSDPYATVVLRHESDDERRYFRLRSIRIADAADEAYLVYTDVTDLERRARERERMANRLERFASIAAHDIRNPLEVAEIRLEAARETHEDVHFEKVAGSLARIQKIVDDVLSVGTASIDPSEAVAIDDCAQAAWDTVDTADATLTVSTDLSTVTADRSRLQQLFENLFRNAVEHGSRETTVTVGRLSDGFYVADDGPGIPPDRRERVFEAGSSTSDDNTGLGLAIVSQIAMAHGWRVTLTTADSGGARFEITGVGDADHDASESA